MEDKIELEPGLVRMLRLSASELEPESAARIATSQIVKVGSLRVKARLTQLAETGSSNKTLSFSSQAANFVMYLAAALSYSCRRHRASARTSASSMKLTELSEIATVSFFEL